MLDSKSLPHLERGRIRPKMQQPSSFSGLPTDSGPSAPIQIPPSRRRPMVDQTVNTIQTVSPPDAVFEMSPVTSEFTARPQPSFMLRRSPDSFLYSVPAFTVARPSSQSISDQLLPSHSDANSSMSCLNKRYRSADPLTLRRNPAPPKSTPALDEYDLSPAPFRADGAYDKEDTFHSWQPEHLHEGLGRLSPGPRPTTYTSPWILPGRGEVGPDEDVAYSQADPSAFEYQRHLLQRIETQKPSRVLNMRSYM